MLRRAFVSAAALFAAPVAVSGNQPMLVKKGEAKAVIVVGEKASGFERWVATELQEYIKKLSGAELPITDNPQVAGKKLLVLVGTLQSHPLIAEAQQKGLVDIATLKPDGFVLKSTTLAGRPCLIVAGNDEAGAMYAVYELLERLGIVFQYTNDIIPWQKRDLALPPLDVRMEPAFKYRGTHCCHGIRWYMGLDDFRKEIDQMAKLKMNVLQFFWGMGAPWVEFSYKGKKAEILYPAESGYCAWEYNYGTAASVKVGRECFPQEYLGPPEFAHVQTQEEAYATAREFLKKIIRHAHQRKVQVWLAVGEMTYVPPNLVPPPEKRLGFDPFYCGVAVPHGDPAALDIYEAALLSMIENYPEADRYWVVTGSEAHISAEDPRTQEMIREYAHLRPLIPSKSEAQMDIDVADVACADKLVRRIKARYPHAKLGVELIFRGGQIKALDAVLPKDVWLMNMVNWEGEAHVNYFQGIEGREMVVWPRLTDDGGELHMQLNAMMYDAEETISGAFRYGVSGIVGQLNKARGAEPNVRYIAEGAWNPDIRCDTFYESYLSRLFGPDAKELLVKAYLLLEENEKALGWHGRMGLFGTYHHGNAFGIDLRQVDYKQEQLQVNREELDRAVQSAEQARRFWEERAAHCRKALELMRQAYDKVLPGSREELDYVIYKTKNFVTLLDELVAAHECKAAFDRALLAISAGEMAQAEQHLQHAQQALNKANRLVVEAAKQMIPYAHHIPTERHILYLFNDAIPSHEYAQSYLSEFIRFYKR